MDLGTQHWQAIERGDEKNKIVVHIKNKGHTINWEEASIMISETSASTLVLMLD